MLIELDPPVELDEGKVIVELGGPVEPVVPEDPVGVVLGLLAPARAPRPVVLAQDHLDVVRALLQHAVRRRQHVPAKVSQICLQIFDRLNIIALILGLNLST